MKVKIQKGLFEARLYELAVTEDCLMLIDPDEHALQIPLRDLRHLSIEGRGCGKKQFILETECHTFEGCFLHREDADALIRQLSEQCGCYLDIRMDMEQEGCP